MLEYKEIFLKVYLFSCIHLKFTLAHYEKPITLAIGRTESKTGLRMERVGTGLDGTLFLETSNLES